jgi:hypothetical protein
MVSVRSRKPLGYLRARPRVGSMSTRRRGAGESEELTQHHQAPQAVVGLQVEEFVDVADIDGGPILFSSFTIQKQREITERRQRDVDGPATSRSARDPEASPPERRSQERHTPAD